MVVAPVTCNSMAKAAHGIGDSLLSRVFVAWEYHKKKILFCPACNADMWNNAPTQRNVKLLRENGIEFLGPRVDKLSNGQVAIGAMALVETIVERAWSKRNPNCCRATSGTSAGPNRPPRRKMMTSGTWSYAQ